MTKSNILEEIIKELAQEVIEERRLRETEVQLTNGTVVKWGDMKHINDLEARIRDLTTWRDRNKRGTEARANYVRLISRLKAELASARKILARKQAEK